MIGQEQHPAVRAYLADVERAAVVLPPARRAELLAELGDHLDDAVAAGAGDAAVHGAIAALGDPAVIVAAEVGPAFGGTPGAAWGPGDAGAGPTTLRWGVREVLAVLLISLGWVIVPVLGPLVGALIAWRSPFWGVGRRRLAFWAVAVPIVVGAVAMVATLVLPALPWAVIQTLWFLTPLCAVAAVVGSLITTIVLATAKPRLS